MLRLLHTARYLKPVQITNRVVRRIRKPRPWGGAVPGVNKAVQPWTTFAPLASSMVDADTVCFLNEPGSSREWQNPNKSHLWLYNLHYFDDLIAAGAAERVDIHRFMLSSWLEANPEGHGVGWEPYPTSLRVVNWMKWLLAGNEALPGMEDSLFRQAHWLSQLLEYHLLGNHLLANAKALVFAGSYFSGEQADGWLQTGLALLDEQHQEQLLADGGHFELSPMYHAIILMDVLDVIQLGGCYPSSLISGLMPNLRERAALMAAWLEGVLHPDRDIPFFNDAAFGIAPEPQAILDYAHALGVEWQSADAEIQHFDTSGYIALRCHGQVAFLDVAGIGPDYIPGHAHADTLSFEWSLHGQRVLVNSGTSEYGVSEERLRQRGTASHNTVAVNGEDSSEVWSGFRVARRARIIDVQIKKTEEGAVIQAAHDGYHRLRPKVTHRREWRISPERLEVHDSLEGHFRSAVAYLHIHPDVSASQTQDGAELLLPNGERCELSVEGGQLSLEDSTWHPEFGKVEKNQRVAIVFTEPRLKTILRH
ncbi:MAG: alginate lyase family protein [Halioglobus sp.]